MGEAQYVKLGDFVPHPANARMFRCVVDVPAGADRSSFRLHHYAGFVLGQRGSLEIEQFKDDSGREVPGRYAISGPWPVGVDEQEFEPWLEYRLALPINQQIKAEEHPLQALRDWAAGMVEASPVTGWRLFRELAHQSVQELLGTDRWWAWPSTSVSAMPPVISPHGLHPPPLYRDWVEKQAEEAGGGTAHIDEKPFRDRDEWIAHSRLHLIDLSADEHHPELPPQEGRQFWDFVFVGPLPRPSSWSIKNLERFLLDAGRMIREQNVEELTIGTPDPRQRPTNLLERAIYGARMRVGGLDRLTGELLNPQLSNLVSYVPANYPLYLTFLVRVRESTYSYYFDWEQRASAAETYEAQRAGSGSASSNSLRSWCDALIPAELLSKVLQTGVSGHRPVSDDGFPDRQAFEELFCYGVPGDAVVMLPLTGRVLGVEQPAIPLVAQIVWPRDGVPLLPHVRARLQRAVLEESRSLTDAFRLHQFNMEYQRYEFVRSLSFFLSHNLPKSAVNPLLLLASRVARVMPEERERLAARIRALANLLDTQLKGLDVFRVPGTREVRTEPLDLAMLLEEVKLVFEAMVEERAFESDAFAKIEVQPRLELKVEPSAGRRLRGYPPGVFHSLLVPVDNALRALDPERVAAEPARGLIEVEVTDEPPFTKVRIRDQAGGIGASELESLHRNLREVAETARQGVGLSIDRHSYNRRGARLGLGLPLATYFMNLLQDHQGHRGALDVESLAGGERTQVTLSFPWNESQDTLTL